jgi:hypothetical protein
MIFRRFALLVFVSFLLVRPSFAAPEAVNGLRLHWLGLKQAGADTNAAPFMKIWQLPQTATLVAQTLDKLSRLPGHGATNAASAALRHLLDDLINSEFYLELNCPTNSQFLFAVRLPADRSRLWQTNLASASAAWQASGTPHPVECSRAGDWTLVGVGLDQKIAKTDFASHLAHLHAPAKLWLEADLNPSMLVDLFSLSARPTGGEVRGEVGSVNSQSAIRNSQLNTILHLHFSLSCDSSNLLTRATLDLTRPLETPLPAWQFPTNLIHGPLTSFAAVRGISNLLAGFPAWQNLQLAPAPDQVCCWSRDGIPFQTYLAAPLPGASNQLAQLSGRLVQNANPWLANNADGNFSWNESLPGILWNDANLFFPFLIGADFNHQNYVLGGLYPPVADAPALPPVRFRDAVQNQPNLVFGEVEGTGSRVEDEFWITQVSRMVFHKPQLPHTAAGTVWLKKIELLLDESATFVMLDGPHRLVVERHSTLGLNALELHLLVDWLESPQFPRGLHTLLAPPDPQ